MSQALFFYISCVPEKPFVAIYYKLHTGDGLTEERAIRSGHERI
jgi:hypothetical protein